MALNVVKFYRGPEASYDATAHAGGIYFATDTHTIWMNGAKYGGGSEEEEAAKTVEDVVLGEDASGNSVLKIKYTDGTETAALVSVATAEKDGFMAKADKVKIDALSETYNSNMADDLATVVDFGGIPAGTTVSELKTKTWAEVLDELIFPTVYPTYVAPKATISLKSAYSAIQEVGATAPTADNFTVGYNAGEITLAGKKQANRAGALTSGTILYGTSTTLPEKVVEGAMNYYYSVDYAEGAQPKDSKGNDYESPLAAGTVRSTAATVRGYRPVYYGLTAASEITESVITGLTKKVSAKTTVKISGPIAEQYICFACPSSWTVSNIKDSNNFDVTGTYTTSTVPVTCLDGSVVNYTVYLSGKMSQPSTYYVNFN